MFPLFCLPVCQARIPHTYQLKNLFILDFFLHIRARACWMRLDKTLACWISLFYVELHTNYDGICITPKRVDKILHEFCSIVGAVFARGVVTRVAPEMKDQDIHEQHLPNKIRDITRGWNVSRYLSSLE